MTIVKVDRTTYQALCLAQAAINFTRANLRYGSANQRADLVKMRNGGNPQGQTLPRLQATRASTTKLLEQRHGALPAHFGQDNTIYARAISAGVAMYYGAGNCGEHANLTFIFLSTFGFPDISLCRASSTVMDHAYTIIDWSGCTDPVVCDAWPTEPQACLWSQFFANPKRKLPDPGYKVNAHYTITGMGNDLLGEAFKAVNPASTTVLSPQSIIKGLSEAEVNSILVTNNNGVYDHDTPLAKAFQPSIDFQYGTELMSKSVPIGQEWTGRILPAIEDVNKQVQFLNPDLRYTGKRLEPV